MLRSHRPTPLAGRLSHRGEDIREAYSGTNLTSVRHTARMKAKASKAKVGPRMLSTMWPDQYPEVASVKNPYTFAHPATAYTARAERSSGNSDGSR